MDDRVQRIQRILDCSELVTQKTNPGRDRAWLSIDLTMPQLKSLIYVTKSNGATSGQIAASLGVGLSTITGIVDRLAEQGMVSRREDVRDRRVTRVEPTPRGRELVEELLQFRKDVISAILARLSTEQLRTVETAFQYLADAVDAIAREHTSKEAAA